MSGDRYVIRDQNALYFLTFTVIDWIDLFSRKEYRFILVDSLNYCIHNKGLEVFAWVVMTNHIHLVARAKEGFQLSNILRDFKKFTAYRIIEEMQHIPESRRVWILAKMRWRGKPLKRITHYKFWKEGSHAFLLEDAYLIDQKINYIHDNPVAAMWVEEPHHYLFSSAKDYAGEKGMVEVQILR